MPLPVPDKRQEAPPLRPKDEPWSQVRLWLPDKYATVPLPDKKQRTPALRPSPGGGSGSSLPYPLLATLCPSPGGGKSLLFWVVLLLLVLWSPKAYADCYQLYRQKKFLQAARCFEQQSKGLSATTRLARYKKGRLLRNAVLCLDRAAKRASLSQAAYLRERALGLIQKYAKERLYESKSQLKRTLKLARDLQRQIGYATLTLVVHHKKARSCLQGKKFQRCHRGEVWTPRLRPGTYQLTLRYPLKPPVTKKKKFTLAPKEKKVLVFHPPIKKEGIVTIITGSPQARLLLQGPEGKPQQHQGAIWIQSLPPGSYLLTVLYPHQQPKKQRFRLASGRSKTLQFSPPAPPQLQVRSQPPGARVYLDGKYWGKTPLKLSRQRKNLRLEVQKGCYLPQQQTVQLADKPRHTLQVKLKRDPVYLAWQKKKQGAKGRRIWGWSTLVAGILLAGGAGLAHGLASDRHNNALQERPLNFEAYSKLASEGNILRTVGYVGIGAAVAALGVGIFGLATAYPPPAARLPCQTRLERWRLE